MTRTNHGATVPTPAPPASPHEWHAIEMPCPYCKQRTLEMREIRNDYGDEHYRCTNKPDCGAKWYAEGADS